MLNRREVLLTITGALGVAAAPAFAWETGPAKKSVTVDVLVIGSGLSGVISALAAKNAGANVLLIDKARKAMRGGNSRVCMGSFLMPKENTPQAKKDFVEAVAKKSLGGGRLDLYQVLADNILPTVSWVESMGGKFEPWLQSAPWKLGIRTASPGAYKGMPVLLETLHKKFESLGGKEEFDTKAKKLLVNESGAVCGCRVQTKEGLVDILAKAVILGTGGYSANKAMLEAAHPGGANLLIRGNKWITGDGIALAREIGAGTRGMAGIESLHLPVVYRGPKRNGSPTRALPYCIGVNREGRRFVDESLGYASFGKGTLQQTGQTVALIFDEALKAKEKRIGMSIELFKKAGGGLVEANGVDALAKAISVPANALRETIESYNKAVKDDGTAPDAVPPRQGLASRIDPNGKLYAFYPLTPSITMDYGGLTVDTKARVTEADGRVIKGLYAAGETINLYYHDYHGGGILAQCLVFGKIAGEGAAALAK